MFRLHLIQLFSGTRGIQYYGIRFKSVTNCVTRAFWCNNLKIVYGVYFQLPDMEIIAKVLDRIFFFALILAYVIGVLVLLCQHLQFM